MYGKVPASLTMGHWTEQQFELAALELNEQVVQVELAVLFAFVAELGHEPTR